MKYVKMLGLLAVAAAALMAFAGTASATLTGTEETKPSTLHATNEGNVILTGPSITITCEHSTVHGHITKNDEDHVEGPITSLTFDKCNHTVTVSKPGSLTATDTDSNTADVFSTGAEVTVVAHVFLLGTVHCIYKTNNTTIGTLTGTGHKNNTKTTATFDISASIPTSPTDGACGSEPSVWEGNYEVTNPDHLFID